MMKASFSCLLDATKWALTVNFQFRLSGESPFLCESEADTFSRITDARWEFTDVFDYVSKEAKDFITRLLLKDPKYLLILDYILWNCSVLYRNTSSAKI